jgi:glycosyltransferase involved in cell wall biosynthesis
MTPWSTARRPLSIPTPRDVTDSLVSVVICAYTLARWDDIVEAVASVEAQDLENEIILVIDYNDDLLARATTQWSAHRVVANTSRQGLSGARNTGLFAARGEFVAFLDDDAAAQPQWLDRLVAPFADAAVVGVGGGSEPVWPSGSKADFYPPELYWIVGSSYTGLPTALTQVRNVIGCSMVFRRETLLAHGGFDLDTGRIGRFPLGCEETEFCIRVHQADPDAQILYEPASMVRHRVSVDRVTWRYLWRRSFYEGVSKAGLARKLGAGDSLSTERSYVASVLPRALVRELKSIGRGGASRGTAILLSLAAAGFGYIYGRAARVDAGSRSARIEVTA